MFFLHSSGARITLEIYGELSERSKVRHSKCRVPKRNLGFESLTLRQKPSHIKAFAHMTGLFFSLKVTSAYMFFGKNSGVPAGLPCVRQSQDIVHYICRGDLGLIIQMAVNIRRRANIAVAQPLLNLLEGNAVGQQQAGAAMAKIMKPHLRHPVFCYVLRNDRTTAGSANIGIVGTENQDRKRTGRQRLTPLPACSKKSIT